MRRLRRIGLALAAAIAFSSTAYALSPLDLLTALNPFRSTKKTQSATTSQSRRPETVAGKGYDARLPNGSYKNGTTQPKGYTPTKTRFWQ